MNEDQMVSKLCLDWSQRYLDFFDFGRIETEKQVRGVSASQA
jgi:hypothetical protein